MTSFNLSYIFKSQSSNTLIAELLVVASSAYKSAHCLDFN